jgi:hypothetical protein
VANLHFTAPGNVFSAKPAVVPSIDDGPMPEPKPVVLPKPQAAL